MKKFKIPKEDQFIKKISVAVGILLFLIIVGSFMHNSNGGDHDMQESIFYTISLITHTDVEEVHSNYVYLLISLFGYIVQFYILYIILEFMLEGKLKNIFSEVKMLNQIKKMKNHYIICGGGRVGMNVAQEMIKYKKPYVIVEAEKERVERLKQKGFTALTGDALDDKELQKLGLEKAGYLAACLGDDGDNILLVLTAKEHCPNLRISARANREKTVNKLRHAGANHIILPEVIGGLQIAHSLIRDDVQSKKHK